jgi:hypothetical protein
MMWIVITWGSRGPIPIGPFETWDDANAFYLTHNFEGLTEIRKIANPDEF